MPIVSLNDDAINNILRNKSVLDSLPEGIFRNLIANLEHKEKLNEETFNTLLGNKEIRSMLKEETIQNLMAVKDRTKRGASSRSKSRNKNNPRHPENEYRNIEGLRPADNYYSKLYKQNRPDGMTKNASQLYKSKAKMNSKTLLISEIVSDDKMGMSGGYRAQAKAPRQKANEGSPYARKADRGRIMDAMRVLSKQN